MTLFYKNNDIDWEETAIHSLAITYAVESVKKLYKHNNERGWPTTKKQTGEVFKRAYEYAVEKNEENLKCTT